MAVVASFPLLNLPYIPLEEVFSYMNPTDLFLFSMLSEKTAKFVKENHTLDLEIKRIDRFNSLYHIVCNNQNGSKFLTISVETILKPFLNRSNMLLQNLCGAIKFSKSDDGSIITFWEDVFEGFKKMTSFICNSFKIRNISIEFYVTNEGELRKIIEHIQKLQSEYNIILRKLKMMTNFHYGTMYKYILKKFNDVPELIMHSPEIKYKYYKDQPDGDSHLKVLRASWFTFDVINLVTKCKKIKLWDLKWTSQEMNQFLKIWSESSKMQNADLFVENADLQIAVQGLSATPQRKNLSFCGEPPNLIDCFEIRRTDGVKANILILGSKLHMLTYQ